MYVNNVKTKCRIRIGIAHTKRSQHPSAAGKRNKNAHGKCRTLTQMLQTHKQVHCQMLKSTNAPILQRSNAQSHFFANAQTNALPFPDADLNPKLPTKSCPHSNNPHACMHISIWPHWLAGWLSHTLSLSPPRTRKIRGTSFGTCSNRSNASSGILRRLASGNVTKTGNSWKSGTAGALFWIFRATYSIVLSRNSSDTTLASQWVPLFGKEANTMSESRIFNLERDSCTAMA